MAWDLLNGYQPRTFAELLEDYVAEYNAQYGTSYDTTSIVGSNAYKAGYTAIQLVMQAEANFAEISAKLLDYIRTSNEKITLPKSTISGFVAGLLAPVADGGLGLISTIKDITDPAEAGYMFLVVDTDPLASNYATIKQGIIDRMHNWLTCALYYNGTETGTKQAVNGQNFTYKFALPTKIDIKVKITITSSKNAKTPILNENQVRDIFNANLAKFYQLGFDFEPEKYLEINRDLPFASNILLEYSENAGSTWASVPRAMAYNEKMNITEPATVIVN
jgi:hypothetical protein